MAVLGLCCFSGFSLVAASVGWSPAARRPLGAEVSLATQLGSKAPGFIGFGSRAEAQELWCTGLAAVGFVESSRTRDGTRVSCIDR